MYKGRIKVIYIDPPYGKDNLGEFAKTNYDNAITRDNLLSMLYPRLMLAKQLLKEDGVIFCSIDDRNQAYIKGLFDEVFGERNFVADFIRKTKSATNNTTVGLNYQHEFLLCYAKNIDNINLLGGEKDLSNYKNPDNDPNGAWTNSDPTLKSLWANGDSTFQKYFPIKNPYTNQEDYPPEGRSWLFSKNEFEKFINEGRICFKKEYNENERGFIYKKYLKDLKTNLETFDSLKFADNMFMNQVATKEIKDIGLVEYFPYPKPMQYIKEILKHSTSINLDTGISDDIVLDFFAGSGTTGHAVLELNREDGGKRQFILVTNNEVTDINPKGIAYDVTSKRLKRIMTGKCYDGTNNFKWLEKNKIYGDSLEVTEITHISSSDTNIFDKIDEKLYNRDFQSDMKAKIDWICNNFEITCRSIEGE